MITSKLKVYIAIGATLLFLTMFGTIKVLNHKLNKEKAEKELYQNNTYTLLEEIKIYQTIDSLNVISVGELRLTLNEYEKYRAEDMALINKLKVDKKKLESITTTQIKTIQELKGFVRDSIVYRDNYIKDTIRCISIADKWFNLNGCSNSRNEFTGKLESKDSLIIVNHVKQKRFLGFLWYCGIKNNRLEVLSKNPNTTIEGAEYIELKE